MFEQFLNKKISRREFIKKSVIAASGLALGAYGIKNLVQKNPDLGKIFKNDAPEKLWEWSKQARYYKKQGDVVQCNLCPNECTLGLNDRGFCRVRVNKEGKLHTLVYGNPCAVHVDPIEKKPLFHFLPRTSTYSIATAGCNFRCLNCQNWEISQSKPEETRNIELFPAQVVESAKGNNCRSIAYTYSEPSVFFEYVLDTAKIAREEGIKNISITNGYLNEKPLRELCKYMDASNVDLKGFDRETLRKLTAGELDFVLNTLKVMKEEGVWVEITNLIVPQHTDDMNKIKNMCNWIVKNLGPDVPLHFSRFHPYYKLSYLSSTPVKTLENARKIALDSGIRYVYIGNVPGHKAQNTYCSNGHLCIERNGFSITRYNLQNGVCKECNEFIAGVWEA